MGLGLGLGFRVRVRLNLFVDFVLAVHPEVLDGLQKVDVAHHRDRVVIVGRRHVVELLVT